MSTRLIVIFLISGLFAHVAFGQGSTEESKVHQVPDSLKAAQAKRIEIKAKLDQPELKDDAIRAALTQQLQHLDLIIQHHKAIAGVKARKTELERNAKTRRSELAKEEARKSEDFSGRQVTVDEKSKRELQVLQQNEALTKLLARKKQIETAVQEREKRLKLTQEETQKPLLEKVTSLQTELEELKAKDPAAALLQMEKLYTAKLERESRGLLYLLDETIRLNGIDQLENDVVEQERKILERKRELLNETIASMSKRLAEQDKKKNLRDQSDVERIQSELKSLTKATEFRRGRLELELQLAELNIASSEFQNDRAEFLDSMRSEGDLNVLLEERDALAQQIKRAKENPDENPLPDSASELREQVRAALGRSQIAKTARKRLREHAPIVAKRFADADHARINHSRKIRAAKEAFRAADEKLDPASWSQLDSDLSKKLSESKNDAANFQKEIKDRLARWGDLEKSSTDDARFLRDRLLWTREDSNVSMESIEQAIDDASELASGTGDSLNKWFVEAKSFVSDETRRTRLLFAVGLVVVFGFLFFLLHSRLPKTYGWLDAHASDTNSLPLVLAIIMRRTDVSFMLAIVFVGAPWIAGLDTRTVQFMASIFAVPFLYRLGRVLIDVLVMPGKNEERVLNLDEDIAKSLHRVGRWLLNLSVVFVPVYVLMKLSGYEESNPGFVELWWLVYESLVHLILLFSILRPAVIGSLIRGSNIVALSVRSWLYILYPLVVAGILFLFILGSLRYLEAEQFFQALFLKSLGLMLVGYVLYRLVLRGFVKGRDLEKNPSPEEFDDDKKYVEAGRTLFFDRFTRFALRILFLVPICFLLYRFWDGVELDFLDLALFGEETVTAKDIFKAVIAVIATMAVVHIIRQALSFVVLPRSDLDKGLRYTISMLVTYGLWTIGIVVTLNLLQIRGEHIAVFTGALAFGIGFGLQSIVKNFVSGLILLVERPVKVGDRVEIGDRSGTVEKITLRATTVMTWDGIGVVIPNETMVGGTLTNHSLGQPRLRSTLSIGVAYGSDIRRVREILGETVKNHGLILKRPAPEVFFVGFGDSSLDFNILYWTSLSTHRVRVISDLRYAIDEAFRREGLEIPFPQRDLNIRSVDPDVAATFRGHDLEKKSAEGDAAPPADPEVD